MPNTSKVWIDEDGDGKADAHGEVVDPVVEEAPVVEQPKKAKKAAKKVVKPVVAPGESDEDRRRRMRHLGF